MCNTVLTSNRPNEPDCTDFTLADANQSIWISIGSLVVYIRTTDSPQGVMVEILPANQVDQPIDTAFAIITAPQQQF